MRRNWYADATPQETAQMRMMDNTIAALVKVVSDLRRKREGVRNRIRQRLASRETPRQRVSRHGLP